MHSDFSLDLVITQQSFPYDSICKKALTGSADLIIFGGFSVALKLRAVLFLSKKLTHKTMLYQINFICL